MTAPVTVRLVRSSAQGVLAVPVSALLALAEGGYALERVGPQHGEGLLRLRPLERELLVFGRHGNRRAW